MAQKLYKSDLAEIFPEVRGIKNEKLRDGVAEIWCEIADEMAWNDLQEIPKNTKGEKGRTLIGHVRGVTQMALAICDTAQRLHGKPFNRDVLVAACLLHDASKPVEYEPDPDKSASNSGPRPGRKSALGHSIQHGVYAAHKMLQKGMSLELVNLVITHTHGSNVRGKTWEAAALFYADFADTDAALSAVAGETLYVQRWELPKSETA